MTSTNLTRDEAAARSAAICVSHYDITLDLTVSERVFPSTTTVTFTANQACDTFLDLRAEKIHSVTCDGVDITDAAVTLTAAGAYDETQGLTLAGLCAGEHTVTVHADAVYSRTGQGLHRYVDPADNKPYLYTQFETADAKRVFACFDQPDMKATYSLSVTTPAEWTLISNAEQTVTVDGDTAVHTSRIDYPLSTYLVAICAGHYYEIRDTWSGTLTHFPETPAGQPHELTIPLGLYCRQSLAKHLDADRLFTETKQGFDFYHANFGLAYPFGKYDQVFVPEFNMGAMENAGCVTHRDEYVFSSKTTGRLYERRCETVLHEMAHMWFGDVVTMRWWDDLWLNESFATWASVVAQTSATEYDGSWVTFANTQKAWAYQQDQLPSTHPISADASDIETVEQNFDGITYAKGASVLKQLQAYVGHDAFFAGVRRHFGKHAFGNATFADLLESLEEASGRDLSGWAAMWLQTTGITTLSPAFSVDDQGRYESFTVTQSTAEPGGSAPRTHRVGVGLYDYDADQGVAKRRRLVTVDITGEQTRIDDLVGDAAADLVIVNDEDLTYCLAEFDEASLRFIGEHIDKITDPLARTLCWSMAWQMTRGGKMRARDFIALVAKGIGVEDQISVLESLLAQVRTAVTSYADPTWAQRTGRAQVGELYVAVARAAAPGSDTQLAAVSAMCQLALTDDTRPIVTAIAAGSQPLDGLVVDNELIWQALVAAIADGAITNPDEAITAHKLKDPSGSGANYALAAAAAVNTPATKQAIFDEVTASDCALSNLAIRHKISGYNHDGSAASLAPLSPQYFAVATTVWEHQTPEMALATLSAIYPLADTSDDALAAADEFLTQKLAPGLARVVAENRDRVRRARRNQRVDAGH